SIAWARDCTALTPAAPAAPFRLCARRARTAYCSWRWAEEVDSSRPRSAVSSAPAVSRTSSAKVSRSSFWKSSMKVLRKVGAVQPGRGSFSFDDLEVLRRLRAAAVLRHEQAELFAERREVDSAVLDLLGTFEAVLDGLVDGVDGLDHLAHAGHLLPNA